MSAPPTTLAESRVISRKQPRLHVNPLAAPDNRGPKVGITPRLDDAELITLVVAQALLGFTFEARGCATLAAVYIGCFIICQHNRATTNGSEGGRGAAGGHLVARMSCSADRSVSRRLDLGRVRAFAGDREYGYCASRSRYFLGTAPASAVDIVGTAGGVRAHWRHGLRTQTFSGCSTPIRTCSTTHPVQALMADKTTTAADVRRGVSRPV